MRAPTHIDVGGLGLHSVAEMAQPLSSPQFGAFLSQLAARGILLNLAGIGNLGLEHVQWIAKSFAPMIAPVGIRKLLVVVPNEWHVRFGAQAAGILQEVTRFGIEPLVLPTSQLGPPGSPIAWFDAPNAQPTDYRAAPPQVAHTQSQGGTNLAVPSSATGFPTGFAAFVGFILGGATGAAFEIAAIAQAQKGVLDAGIIGSCAFGGLIVAPLLTFWIIKLRGTPLARVSWDERGLTEWLGNKPRAFIAWSSARYAILETKVQVVRNGRATGPAQHQGYVMQISDGAGERITLIEGTRAPDWMHGRACQVASLSPLRSLLGGQPLGTVVPDERALGRASFLGFGVAAWIAYALVVGGTLLASQAHYGSDLKLGGLLIATGAFFLLVRAIAPLRMLLRASKTKASTASPLVELVARILWAAATAIAGTLMLTAQ
jgi:hypothetical protein